MVTNAAGLTSTLATGKQITFAAFDGTTIPANIGNYDMVYMIDVYHHIPKNKRQSIITQVYNKMKPGAKLMLKDIDGSSPFVLCNKLHDLIFAQELSHEIGFKKAQALLRATGFRVLEARKKQVLMYPHYFLLAQKETRISPGSKVRTHLQK